MGFRPWEAAQCNPLMQPWEATNSPFNRTVAVHRQISIAQETPAVGDVGYSGAEQTTTPATGIEGEQVLMTGLPASIQITSPGRTKGILPADVVYRPQWRILIQASAAPIYSIRDRDLLIDDEGYRYSVIANGWTSMGYQLEVIRLEA
jgi:hypothetical protein